MTRMGQVIHLMKKDVLYARWWLAAYVVITIVVTLFATDVWMSATRGPEVLLSPLMWMLGGLIAAMLVQADSPTNASAFWASRPISANAMMCSKLLIALIVLLGVPLLGTVILLLRFQLSPSLLGAFIASTAWIYSAWLLIAMMLGAHTRRVPAFLAAVISPLVIYALANYVLEETKAGPSIRHHNQIIPFGIAATIGAALLLTRVYRRRSTNRWWLVCGIGAVIVGMIAISGANEPTTRNQGAFTGLPPVHIAIQRIARPKDAAAWAVQLSFIAAGNQEAERFMFSPDSVLVTGSNGRIMRVSAFPVMLNSDDMYGMPEWLPAGDSVSVGSYAISLRDEQRDSLGGDIAKIRVMGAVRIAKSVPIASFPASIDTTVLYEGIAVRVHGFTRARTTATLDITGVYGMTANTMQILNARINYRARLVWPLTADTVMLTTRHTLSDNQMPILPGATVHEMRMQLALSDMRTRGTAHPPVDEAKLELVYWKSFGRYPVEMERDLPPFTSLPLLPAMPSPASSSSVILLPQPPRR